MEKNGPLPIYGPGPLYGAFVIGTTILALGLELCGILDSGKAEKSLWVLVGLGIFTLILGLCIWIPAAFGKKAVDHFIKREELCTTGVYGLVRNPCYAGIGLIATGVLLLFHNFWLLILPPVYWLFLTEMVRYTEERWLTEKFGRAYLDYCKRVHRCLPWFPKG